jgi:hypothetical protein
MYNATNHAGWTCIHMMMVECVMYWYDVFDKQPVLLQLTPVCACGAVCVLSRRTMHVCLISGAQVLTRPHWHLVSHIAWQVLRWCRVYCLLYMSAGMISVAYRLNMYKSACVLWMFVNGEWDMGGFFASSRRWVWGKDLRC